MPLSDLATQRFQILAFDRRDPPFPLESRSDGAVMRLGSFGDVGLWAASDSPHNELRLGPGKPLALLVYLAAAPGRRSSREHLLELLWSDSTADEARHVLRQVTWQLRRRLGDDIVQTVGDDLLLTDQVESDRTLFLDAFDAGRLEDALAVYRGEFLPSFATPGATGFERWADLERLRLRSIFLRAAETVARQFLAGGQPRAAVALARRARDADRLSPSAWRLLLEALSSAGDTLGALTEADALEETFRTEEIEVDAATLAAIRLVRRLPSEVSPEDLTRGRFAADLVGREREFSAIIQAWHRARHSGAAQSIRVLGDAGIGKTRLLTDVLARLRASRARVAYVRAYPNQQSIPFGLLGDIVGVLAKMPGAAGVSPTVAGSLIALAPGLAGAFPSAISEPSSHEDALRRRYLAVHELLVAVSDEVPLALFIDDVHWADGASRAALLAVLDRLSTERLLVVSTSRPLPGTVETGGLTLRLSALTAEDVEALVASLGELPDLRWSDTFASALHRATSGVPLLTLEVLQDLLDQQLLVLSGGAWAAPQPAVLLGALRRGVALQQRVGRLDADARTILLHLAIAGGPTPLARLTRSLGFADDVLASHLDALERAGHIKRAAEGLEVAHDSIADVVIASAAVADARTAHASCGAVIMEERSANFAELVLAARHLEAAGIAERLPDLLMRAALVLRRSGDRRSPQAIAVDVVREVLGPQAARERSATLEHQLRRRLNRPRRQLVAASALVLCSLGTWAVGRILAAPTRQPAASLLVVSDFPFDFPAFVIDLTRAMFDGSHKEPLDARTLGRAHIEYAGSPFFEDQVVESPAGSDWLIAAPGRIFSRLMAGRHLAIAPIVRHLGYVRDPSWSPDGSEVVFARERDAGPGYELALVERMTKRVRPLFPAPSDSVAGRFATDRTPVWGPDGTRIAFVRASTDSEPGSLCWSTADGKKVSCHSSSSTWAVRAWRGTTHVIVESVSGGKHDLSEVHIDSGSVHVLVNDVGDTRVSADGQWFVQSCQTRACGPSGWVIGLVSRPSTARPLIKSPSPEAVRRYEKEVKAGRGLPHGLTSKLHVFWRAPRVAPPYVASLRVGMDFMVPGEPARFTIDWLDQHGRPIRPSVVSAYATEPEAADLEQSGRVLWRRALVAGRFVFTAGGWRADTAVLVGPDSLGKPASFTDSRRIIRDAVRRWSQAAPAATR